MTSMLSRTCALGVVIAHAAPARAEERGAARTGSTSRATHQAGVAVDLAARAAIGRSAGRVAGGRPEDVTRRALRGDAAARLPAP